MIPADKQPATFAIVLARRFSRDHYASIANRPAVPQPGGHHGSKRAHPTDAPIRSPPDPARSRSCQRPAFLQPCRGVAPRSAHAARGRPVAALLQCRSGDVALAQNRMAPAQDDACSPVEGLCVRNVARIRLACGPRAIPRHGRRGHQPAPPERGARSACALCRDGAERHFLSQPRALGRRRQAA
jgi:hypothetical protein